MSKLHTHYDNLKVSRDAPAPVIKAAYKVLAQANHPDKCRDAQAPKRMQMINDAYAVLSNPDERAKHDRWISRNETVPAAPAKAAAPVIDKRTTLPVDSAYVEKLHTLYRERIRTTQHVHEAEIKNLKSFMKFQKTFYIMAGVLISIPIHIIFTTLDHAINSDQATHPQHQEAPMIRN